jgi:hypothetical protein
MSSFIKRSPTVLGNLNTLSSTYNRLSDIQDGDRGERDLFSVGGIGQLGTIQTEQHVIAFVGMRQNQETAPEVSSLSQSILAEPKA